MIDRHVLDLRIGSQRRESLVLSWSPSSICVASICSEISRLSFNARPVRLARAALRSVLRREFLRAGGSAFRTQLDDDLQ